MQAHFPAKLAFLWQPKRYKVAYGGRGAGRSWGFARALLLRGAANPHRVLCVREFQNSIGESVHRVLADQNTALGLPFVVEKARIYNPNNGSEFYFEGIKNNPQRIKSYEGIDIAWAEEANKITKSSWEFLVPTIRKEESEIWVSYNPELETDETHRRFVIEPERNASKRLVDAYGLEYGFETPDEIVVKMTWQDNPWLPEVLRREKDNLKAKDLDAYLNIWEGQCRVVLDGAVYSKEIRALQLENRVCNVPYDRSVAVDTFWDLGRSDFTAIWFVQRVAFEYRILDFYQNHMEDLDHYIQLVQQRGYSLGTMWLPHDAKAKSLGTKKSVEEQMREKFPRVRLVPKLSLVDGILAARQVFPRCYFDKVKTSEGLQALRHYKYDVDNGQFGRFPLHDENSHAADAFRYLAVASSEPSREIDGGRIADYGRQMALTVAMPTGEPLGWMR